MKKLLFFLFSIAIFFPIIASAQEISEQPNDEIFKARIIEVTENNNFLRSDGSTSIQQKIKLVGLDKNWKNKEIIYDGTEYDMLSENEYEVGDKVIVGYSKNINGEDKFYILGFSRATTLYWIALLFAFVVVLIGRLKGLRAIIVLVFTFFIILKFIVPQILAGRDPLFITIIGSLIILFLAVYITEGFKRTSTISIFSILISLIITGLLSVWFTAITNLTGFASEESLYLIGLSGGDINIKGLLLAGIIIGALGVLDDVVISQVALVNELKITNPKLSNKQIYQKAMRVGVSHLSSMTNTLFLAYAGAALPLLILFGVNEPPFLSFNQVIDNEMIATEIVRTLTGSIGLVLAVPIATLLAVQFIINKKHSD